MNKTLLVVLFAFIVGFIQAQEVTVSDSIRVDSALYDVDDLLDSDSVHVVEPVKLKIDSGKQRTDTPKVKQHEVYSVQKVIRETPIVPLDSLFLEGNPLYVILVMKKEPVRFTDLKLPGYKEIYFGKPVFDEDAIIYKGYRNVSSEQIIEEVRKNTYKSLLVQNPYLFRYREESLPSVAEIQQRLVTGRTLNRVTFVDDSGYKNGFNNKIVIEKAKLSPWTHKAYSQLHFTQNMASDNWYQGGSSTMSVLGILTGKLNYDNRKDIQWENNAEWRMGFNSVFNDSTALRAINTNEDVFKINSKLGIKAGGNWFYSGSVDFSTQFLNNYKAVNSSVLKSTFLTPVRLNIGVGLDYKYKKLFSLMVSPVSYKYIYANNITDVSPKLFGIKEGEHVLSEIGSSFKAQFNYSPVREIQIDSRLSFYTNYTKVEVDWEIVGNFTINRFLSTRLSVNPRYDNTMILAAGEKAKLQFKELLSFGLTYKLID